METYIVFLREQWTVVHQFLSRISFNIAGINISFIDILFGFMLISIVISIFWRGGKT